MIEGTMKYATRVEGIEFGPIQCHFDHPSVTKVEVSSSNGGEVTFLMVLAGAASQEEAHAISRQAVNRVADVLSINLGRFVPEPRLAEEALSEVTVEPSGTKIVRQLVGSGMTMSVTCFCVNVLGGESLRNLADALSQANPPGEFNYVLFRTALNTLDPASKFLALYQILALLIGDTNQDDIDAYILSLGPVPVTNTRPKKDGTFKDETVYTRLRNEYMHVRPGATLAKTRAEMETNLEGLIAIVRAAIKDP